MSQNKEIYACSYSNGHRHRKCQQGRPPPSKFAQDDCPQDYLFIEVKFPMSNSDFA